MEGQVTGSISSWHVTRRAEPSRLQLEHVRRAFEFLVSNARHPVVPSDGLGSKHVSATLAVPVTVKGD